MVSVTVILGRVRSTARDEGVGLGESDLLGSLELDDAALPELLDLAHWVRLRIPIKAVGQII